MDKTTQEILDCLFRLGRCSILAESTRTHNAAQKLINAGFCKAVKLDKYEINTLYSLRLTMGQLGKDNVIVTL